MREANKGNYFEMILGYMHNYSLRLLLLLVAGPETIEDYLFPLKCLELLHEDTVILKVRLDGRCAFVIVVQVRRDVLRVLHLRGCPVESISCELRQRFHLIVLKQFFHVFHLHAPIPYSLALLAAMVSDNRVLNRLSNFDDIILEGRSKHRALQV